MPYDIESLFGGDWSDVFGVVFSVATDVAMLTHTHRIVPVQVRDCLICLLEQNKGWIYRHTSDETPCSLHISADYSRMEAYMPPCEDVNKQQDCLKQLLRIALECAMLKNKGMISIHAACVAKDGQAFVISGPSGIGKSTQARNWNEALDSHFVSGDNPVLWLTEQGVMACGVPWDGKEQVFSEEVLPLRAIMDVRRAPFAKLCRFSRAQAYRMLAESCFVPTWDRELAIKALEQISRLADEVAIYRYFCNMDTETAVAAYDALMNNDPKGIIAEEKPVLKLKEGYVLRNVLGEHIVMPTNDEVRDFKGALVLNEVAAFVWEQLKRPISKENLVDLVLSEYDVDKETAQQDIERLIERLNEYALLEDELA